MRLDNTNAGVVGNEKFKRDRFEILAEKTKNRREFFRALKFLLISISAGVIQIVAFTLLSEFVGVNYWISYLTGLLLSIIWNFTINRKYTFKSANNIKVAMLLVLAFYVVFTPLSTWLGNLCEGAGVNEYIVLAVTMILNFVLEFLYTRYVVYKNSCDTAIKASVEIGSSTVSADGDSNNMV